MALRTAMERERAKVLLDAASRIVVLTHVSPDGDAIGTLLGVGHALRQLGKTVTLAVDEGVPPGLRFLPGSADVRDHLTGVQADLVVAVDCGDENRMGEVGKAARALAVPLINVDHHPTNTRFGDVNIIEGRTVASAEVVLDLLDDWQWPLTPDVAQCLLCGLVTDTLCFRTSNVTADTLGKAQRLMQAGGDLTYVVQNTVNRMSTDIIRLWGQVMPTVRIEDHVIWAVVTREARRVANVNGSTKDGGLVSLLLQADEAYISCVLTEKDDDKIELSFRAIPGFDVSQVAANLGGGGHVQASGATVSGTLSDVEARVIPMLKEAARAGSPVVG
jgi:phosphoesterase RecJ-like protein